MKIGILTYHWVANYGANLQMYSTYMFLKNNGYSPILINYIPRSTFEFYLIFAGQNQINSHSNFLNNHCETTREFSELSDFPDVLHDYNITHIVVGSDSLFNLIKDKYSWISRRVIKATDDHRFPNPFWCTNVDVPHVALSVSSQNARFKDFTDIKEEINESLISFNKITVRDDWTKKMVSFFTDGKINPSVTPDPVFSFNYNVKTTTSLDYIRTKFNLPKKYILFTFNNGRMRAPKKGINEVKKQFNEFGYACVYLPKSTGSQKL
ncbi:MAG: polysaccharide pyruvyl transferase family protein, partial [Bacteroidales bacterium]|nr:polysaccharide pyruvyl transferase family protein [Bacteroidales bacterium]